MRLTRAITAWPQVGRLAVVCGVVGRCFSSEGKAFTPPGRGKLVHFVRHGTAVHNVRYKQKDVVFKDLIAQRSKTEVDREDRWLFPEIEEWAYMTNETVDTALVETGIAEAQALGAAWAQDAACLHGRHGNTGTHVALAMRDIDLVVTSPLTRTLQTTLHIFFKRGLLESGLEAFVPRWQPLPSMVCEGCSPDEDLQSRVSKGATRAAIPIIALDIVKEWSQGRHTPNRRKTRAELAEQYPQVDFSYLDSESDELWREFWPGSDGGLEPRSHLESRVAQFKEWLATRPEKNIAVVSHGTFLGNLLFGTFIEDTNEMAHCQIYVDRV